MAEIELLYEKGRAMYVYAISRYESSTVTRITNATTGTYNLKASGRICIFFDFSLPYEIIRKTSLIKARIVLTNKGSFRLTNGRVYLNTMVLTSPTALRLFDDSNFVVASYTITGNINGGLKEVEFVIDKDNRNKIMSDGASVSFGISSISSGEPSIDKTVLTGSEIKYYGKDENLLYTYSSGEFKESSPYVLNNGVWTPATVNRFDGTQWKDA